MIGQWDGITIFLDRTSTTPINLTGNGGLQLTGLGSSCSLVIPPENESVVNSWQLQRNEPRKLRELLLWKPRPRLSVFPLETVECQVEHLRTVIPP